MPSHCSIYVVDDASLAKTAESVHLGIDELGTFITHCADVLETPESYRLIEVVDCCHSRNEPECSVLWSPQTVAVHLRDGGVLLNVPNQVHIQEERWSVDVVRNKVILEVARVAFHESVVFVNDVTCTVVEHAHIAPKGCEAVKGIHRWRRVGRLQVPAKATRVRGVVEERHVRGSGTSTCMHLDPPTSDTVGREVVSVPLSEARQPESSRVRVV
mmetsp:Transcript_21857/g.57915  ORF Transcript_21857/g.57915 Transcript_21857/m.57915 type:complete len:215 (-) Transcript_21857:195-839(-)